jgi:hypothetical protein
MPIAIELQRHARGIDARQLAQISNRLIRQHGVPAEWSPDVFEVMRYARCALAMRDALRWCEANHYPVEMKPVSGPEYRARFLFAGVRHAIEFAARWRRPTSFSPVRDPIVEHALVRAEP